MNALARILNTPTVMHLDPARWQRVQDEVSSKSSLAAMSRDVRAILEDAAAELVRRLEVEAETKEVRDGEAA